MKKLYNQLILESLFFILFVPLCFAGEEPLDVRNAADEGIRIFLKDPRMTGLHRLGFESQYDIDYAALGDGFQIFTVPTDKLLNESDSQDIQSLVTPTNQWEFLVIAGNKTNALLTVDLVDGKWTPVGIGSSGLAKKLSKLLEAWPASVGYQYRLIIAYQVNAKFVEILQGDMVIGLLPLLSSNATMGEPTKEFDPTDIREAKDVLNNLRSTVLRNIQSGQ